MHEQEQDVIYKNTRIFRDLKEGRKNENLNKSFRKEVT